MTNDKPLSKPRLTKSGVGRIITVILSQVITAAVFFLSAGILNVSRGWLYYGGQLAYMVLAMAVIISIFPEVIETVNARGKLKKDIKGWDKLFGIMFSILLLLQPAVAGWDAGRLHSFEAPWVVSIIAFIMTIMANAFIHWAMIANKYAELGVRIQDDRHHAVVISGPYSIIRHPFYCSFIVIALALPLALSSLYAFIPSLALVVLVIWRTAREDKTLRHELDGYEEYTRKTRYRLLPGVW